jgi:hypothetical protein
MTRKTRSSPTNPNADLRTDYALMATAITATLLALIYLLVT